MEALALAYERQDKQELAVKRMQDAVSKAWEDGGLDRSDARLVDLIEKEMRMMHRLGKWKEAMQEAS